MLINKSFILIILKTYLLLLFFSVSLFAKTTFNIAPSIGVGFFVGNKYNSDTYLDLYGTYNVSIYMTNYPLELFLALGDTGRFLNLSTLTSKDPIAINVLSTFGNSIINDAKFNYDQLQHYGLRYRLGTLNVNPYVGAGLLKARASSLDIHWQVTNNGYYLEFGICNSRTKKLLLDLTIRYCHVDFDIDPNKFSGTHRIRSLGSFASIGYKF